MMLSKSKLLSLDDDDKDRISELPDDILCTLVSHFELKEAVRTSLLSRRWRYIWTCLTHLDFDPYKILPNTKYVFEFTEVDKRRYMDWVDQVVRMHRAQLSIDKFRLWFHFDTSDFSRIDRWVKFALSKRVKNLNLDLLYGGPCYAKDPYPYALGFDILKHSPCHSGISSLTSLKLSGVSVTGEFLEFILSKCNLLEVLEIAHSKALVSLKVKDSLSGCRLKSLSLCYCSDLKEIEIDASCLESFEYMNIPRWESTRTLPSTLATIDFKSVPALVDAKFGGECCTAPFPIWQHVACFSMQLSKLSLYLTAEYFDRYQCPTIPCFYNVKHLELASEITWNDPIHHFLHYAGACPNLYQFKLQIIWHDHRWEMEANQLKKMRSQMNGKTKSNGEGEDGEQDYAVIEETHEAQGAVEEHQQEQEQDESKWNMKVLNLVGFMGCDVDVKLTLFLADNAVGLTTIICDPRDPGAYGMPSMDPKRTRTSRIRAHKLAELLPPTITVNIL